MFNEMKDWNLGGSQNCGPGCFKPTWYRLISLQFPKMWSKQALCGHTERRYNHKGHETLSNKALTGKQHRFLATSIA